MSSRNAHAHERVVGFAAEVEVGLEAIAQVGVLLDLARRELVELRGPRRRAREVRADLVEARA